MAIQWCLVSGNMKTWLFFSIFFFSPKRSFIPKTMESLKISSGIDSLEKTFKGSNIIKKAIRCHKMLSSIMFTAFVWKKKKKEKIHLILSLGCNPNYKTHTTKKNPTTGKSNLFCQFINKACTNFFFFLYTSGIILSVKCAPE